MFVLLLYKFHKNSTLRDGNYYLPFNNNYFLFNGRDH